MIAIPRGRTRTFRALLRKCVSGRPRSPAPAVVFECKAGTLTVWAQTADAALVYSAVTRCDDRALIVPTAVLDAVAGGADDAVEFAVGANLRGEARFADRGVPRVHAFDAILPGGQHRPPDPPADWHPAPPDLLRALHECGRTTAREPGRYALSRVQVRGEAGQVIGTDGRVALVWSGFGLPFAEDVLIPALPVFGTPEVRREKPVRVGRAAAHLVVAAGPWMVFLSLDPNGRYPDVAGVAPRNPPSVAGIDRRDAADLAARLPAMPGAAAEQQPVTLDLDGGVAVRARDEAAEAVDSIRLERSPAAGPPARVVLDRRVLARALALGCHTVRVAPDKPVAFEGENKTLIAVALDPALAVGATPTDTATPGRTFTVKHETNGHGPLDPPAADPPDLLTAAEELRAAIADALTKAGKLVTAVKATRRHQKVLSQVWTNLRALNLGGGGGP